MTEKSESFEICPMRGHSRGEWWGTLNDIVDSDRDAEYWAVFGITHRGNRHCLGEFPSKSAAIAALGGMSFGNKRKATRCRHLPEGVSFKLISAQELPTTKIVALDIAGDRKNTDKFELIGICNDGTFWRRRVNTRKSPGSRGDFWEQISPDELDSGLKS